MKLDITKASVKFPEILQPKQFRKIVRTTLKLRDTPELHDSKRLVDYPEYLRIDIGEYRIIYRIDNDTIHRPNADLWR